ncbi:MAG TPA: hypothetical protein VFB62_05715 [Polyangiaceae bacterium]|jgi:hypothetical protein|nr:hypothetical protein [Polyangiaceae bacterium]
MEQLTFRDFAGALMSGDAERAARVLAEMLAIDDAAATSATAHFQQQMAQSPTFLQKAMGMRQVVESRDEPALVDLLVDCFGIERARALQAAAALLARYK